MSQKNQLRSQNRLIISGLKEIPDKSLLDMASTDDQRKFWYDMQARMTLISWCWAAMVEMRDDPLEKAVQFKIMDQIQHDIIWSFTYKYWALWSLVQISVKFIKQQAKRSTVSFPFGSSLELFLHLVEADVEASWAECLQDYRAYYSSHAARRGALYGKGLEDELSPNEIKEIKLLSEKIAPVHHPKLDGVSWWHIAMAAWVKRWRANDSLIRLKFGEYVQAFATLEKLTATAINKRYSPTWDPGLLRSYAWIDGRKTALKHGRLPLQNFT